MDNTIHTADYTLGQLLADFWHGRVFVFAGLMLGALAAFSFMALAVPQGGAQMVIAPASPLEAQRLASEDAPVSTADAQNAAFTNFTVSYKGAAVAEILLRDPEITKGLAADRAFKFSAAETAWTPEKLSEYIARRVRLNAVGETPLRSLNYLHPDKEFAAAFLQRLHNVTDGLIRHTVRRNVNDRITYLEDAMMKTGNPEHRRAMTDLLMEQERQRMLVSIDQPYAAAIVVPAMASAKMLWPDPALVYAGMMAVGALFGFIIFSMRTPVQAQMQARTPRPQQAGEWFKTDTQNNNEQPFIERRRYRGRTGSGQ